jgi:acetyltransferase EpsM
MTQRVQILLIGGGEHASVVADAIRSRPDSFELLGFVDPVADSPVRRMGLPHLGDDGEGVRRLKAPGVFAVLGVGGVATNEGRRRVAETYRAAGARFAAVAHSTAWVSPTATMEPGAVVLASASVNTGAVLGENCVINTGAIVEHDVRIGAFVQVGPGAAVGGGVAIGANAYVGLGARVRDHVRIGDGALVGMGAVVVADVAAGVTVMGVPARRVAP